MSENIEEKMQTLSNENDFRKETNEKPPKANTFFYIMLVLSMINAGVSFISNILWGIFSPTIERMYENGSLPIPEELEDALYTQLRKPYYYFFIVAIFCALSFYGALAMWKLRKTGFHSYTLAQFMMLLLPLLFLGKAFVNWGDIMFTLLFVAFYASVIFTRKPKNTNG